MRGRRATDAAVRRRVLVAVGAIATAACGTAGADAERPDDAPVPAPSTTVDSPPRAELVRSGVGVRAGGCGLAETFGSGVVVETPGVVATVAHTIAGADDITVIDAGGTEHAAQLIAFDPDADLAALSAPTLTAPPLEIGDVQTGSATALRWRPDEGVSASEVEITRRLGITIEDIYVEDEVRRTGMELAADVVVGDSGGPIVDPHGDVVGIVYANSRSRPGIGFATDDAELRDLLAAVDGRFHDAESVDSGPCL